MGQLPIFMLILSSQVLKSLLKISIYIKCKKLNFLLRLFKYLKIKIALHFSMVTHIFIQFNFQIFCTISERTRAQEDPIEVEQINFAHPVQCLTQVVYEQNLIDIGFNQGWGQGGEILSEWNFSAKMSDRETQDRSEKPHFIKNLWILNMS